MIKWALRLSCAVLTPVVLALLGGFTYEEVGRNGMRVNSLRESDRQLI